MYEVKTDNFYEEFRSNKEMLDFSNYSTKPKYYENSNKLVIGKMKCETRGVGIQEFVGLNSKIYSVLVNDNWEYEKEKAMNRNVVVRKSHNEFKYELFNNKCLRHSVNRTQSK